MNDISILNSFKEFYSTKVLKKPQNFTNFNEGNVYHYTNIDSLEQIITTKSLCISKSNYLNDKTELDYAFNLIYQIYNNSNEYKNISLKIMNVLINMIKESLEESYILSFSVNNDSLILWGNYSQFEGYNIDFNIKELFDRFKDEKVYIISNEKDKNGCFKRIRIEREDTDENISMVSGKVIYDLETQIEIIKNQLISLDDLNKNFYKFIDMSEEYKNTFSDIKNKICKMLAMYVQLFKNPSFQQEEEYRILFTLNKKMDIVKYRKCSGIFIPYIKIAFEDYNDKYKKGLPIEGINIGPKNNMDIAINGLKAFLESEGYKTTLDDNVQNTEHEYVIIKKSKIPLRY